MKKNVSYLLFFAMLLGMLSSFSFATEVDTPYSGGSGTEEDPYLISTEDDILELHNALKTDPSLWYTKYYYKLTNNIETSYDLYVPSCIETFSSSSFQLADENIRTSELVPIYRHFEGESPRGYYEDMFGAIENKNGYYNSYFYSYGDYPWFVNKITYYWNAAFTGIFDGDGHTIKMNKKGSFFGFLENGAQVKNLTIEGDEGSFVYNIDHKSVIANCKSIGPQGNNVIGDEGDVVLDGITNDGFGYRITDNNEVYIRAFMEFGDTVVIPETINDMPVVGINKNAFLFRTVDIESFYIHDGLRTIEIGTFIDVEIGTIYYSGTQEMLENVYYTPEDEYWLAELWELYPVVYDYEPIEGFALAGGQITVSLGVGDTFKLEYEVYPENGKGTFQYSYDQNYISIKNGVITGVKPGETTVTVTAESGVTYTFTVKVIGAVGISVMNPPSKTYYGLRESLDVDGLKIIKQYNDGTFVELTDYKLSSFNPLQRGLQTITVTGEGFTTTFNVFVSGALKGDNDLDGRISSIDSNRMKRIIVGDITVDEYTDGFFASDLNGDGKINALDSALLKSILVGK